MERLPDNGNNDIVSGSWIVNAKVDGEPRRFGVDALSEQDACMQIEDRYADVEVISAYPNFAAAAHPNWRALNSWRKK